MVKLFLPVFLGAASVLQAVLNREIANRLGLAAAVWINSVILFVLVSAIVLFLLMKPDVWPALANWQRWEPRWWWVVPGLCGFAIVTLLPVGVGRYGATVTMTLVIAAQCVTSFIWDTAVKGEVVDAGKIGAAVLVVVGATLMMSR